MNGKRDALAKRLYEVMRRRARWIEETQRSQYDVTEWDEAPEAMRDFWRAIADEAIKWAEERRPTP